METFETFEYVVVLDCPDSDIEEPIGDGFDLDDMREWLIRGN